MIDYCNSRVRLAVRGVYIVHIHRVLRARYINNQVKRCHRFDAQKLYWGHSSETIII